MTLRTLNYGNYGIFLIMGSAGICPSAVGPKGFGASGDGDLGFGSEGGRLLLWCSRGFTVNRIKLETGLRPNSAGIPYTLLLRIEAMKFPTFGLLL